jgi:hypothetical protein
MKRIEHAVDVWDLAGTDPRLNSKTLLQHLHDFAADGWELVWMALHANLADHNGPCHLLVFKRVVES